MRFRSAFDRDRTVIEWSSNHDRMLNEGRAKEPAIFDDVADEVRNKAR
jgi:hypothetical protein